MGIRGLTKFIESRADLYMEKCKLHDTSLVIDGIAVAFEIFNVGYPVLLENACFGGDFDLYNYAVNAFFHALSECNITAYVIMDGGVEAKKMVTIVRRLKDKLENILNMSMIPLSAFVVKTFIDIAARLNVKMVQCDFEADEEIASIAYRLGCPVLGQDSDFYIFGGLYISFSRLIMTVKQKLNRKNVTYNYLDCEVYSAEKFVQSHHLKDKSVLPLLAILLGNDFVKKGVVSLVGQDESNNIEKYNSESHILDVLAWLENQTRDSAIIAILKRYPKGKKRDICKIIIDAINGYNYFDSIYLKYLNISIPEVKTEVEPLELEKFVDVDDIETEGNESDCASDCDPEMIFTEDNTISNQFSDIFLDNFRRCIYPSCFMDILLRHKQYLNVPMEDVTLDNVHVVGFEVLSAIFKILTGLSSGLLCIGRVGSHLGKLPVPAYNEPLPTLQDIKNMNNTERQKIFFSVLKVDGTFKYYLNLFPNTWHIYILAIKYAVDRSKLNLPMIYCLILSKIIISCIDEKIGFCRSITKLMSKYSTELNTSAEIKDEPKSTRYVSEYLEDITAIDSMHFMSIILRYFRKKSELATSPECLDRRLVHYISEFQSILLYLKYLNNVLQRPYPNFVISDCLNCTFVYNFTEVLKCQEDIENYLTTTFSKSPSVLRAVNLAMNTVKEFYSTDLGTQNNVNKNESDDESLIDLTDQMSLVPEVDSWEELEDKL
ncbi:unnamed protein product [Acanthoscelides obtectus]|uniref:Protein asteroid n=1 Tax=Acanthoscelides obtectus TaxID=200917 RepID=A0A9P0LM42_ACAOB|nr:unnamed protein product [Acanthoscelides obtectus]CAK1664357.1 Protein asteroid [Acanthoscelides obtectus]